MGGGSVMDRPFMIMHFMHDAIQLSREHWAPNYEEGTMALFEEVMKEMTQNFMGMARVTYTPMPYVYSQFMVVFVYLFLWTMPLMYVREVGHQIFLVIPFALCLLTVWYAAVIMEDPFGNDINDLPLSDLF